MGYYNFIQEYLKKYDCMGKHSTEIILSLNLHLLNTIPNPNIVSSNNT